MCVLMGWPEERTCRQGDVLISMNAWVPRKRVLAVNKVKMTESQCLEAKQKAKVTVDRY